MHGRLACAALCALLFLIPTASASADNNFFAQPKPLFLGTADSMSNAGGTVEPGETMTTMASPGLNGCLPDPGEPMDFSQVAGTFWWTFTGTGRQVTVTTAGSTFDTHLGIFPGAINGQAFCQDANGGESITIDTTPGQVYRVQVGYCAMNPDGCGTSSGTIRVLATSPAPANDARSAAAVLLTGQNLQGDNYASSEEAGETLVCGGQPYGRTVWYRWTAPTVGRVLLTASSPTAAIAVFTPGGVPQGCDATPGGDARLALNVRRGEYLVQVAGVGTHNGLVSDSAQSRFTLQATFTESADRDDDGVENSRDCQPDDARARPGLRDRPRNGIDEDCDGKDANYPRIRSRASLGVRVLPAYARVTAIAARNVPAGAKVQLRCSGRSCPFRQTRARTIRRTRSSVSLMTSALRAKRIVPTTTLEVRVTHRARIGRIMRFRFRKRGENPVMETRCVVPGSSTPRRC
jgi:hypothetical protein